jgi:hypothetical protein
MLLILSLSRTLALARTLLLAFAITLILTLCLLLTLPLPHPHHKSPQVSSTRKNFKQCFQKNSVLDYFYRVLLIRSGKLFSSNLILNTTIHAKICLFYWFYDKLMRPIICSLCICIYVLKSKTRRVVMVTEHNTHEKLECT